MLSLVSALLPPGSDPRSYTLQEQANIEIVLKLRSAPFSERKNYMHPAMVRHRWGFASLADVTGMKDGVGYDASTCSDRVDTIEDLIAKDDRVWAVWTMRGTHTGQLFGIPPTGKPIEILEAGIWRLADGLVIEAWFFGDELRLLRQLGVIDDAQLRAATVPPASERGRTCASPSPRSNQSSPTHPARW
jgi:predicted ester cyclase